MTKSRTFAPIIAAVLLFLPVLYVGSYCMLVVPGGIPMRTALPYGGTCISMDAHYRLADTEGKFFYWPLEQIDDGSDQRLGKEIGTISSFRLRYQRRGSG
jgi:hypothetical protein